MDPVLTRTLVDTTLELLAHTGLGGVNTDVIAARAHAGKAAIYRRWPSTPDLIAHAVGTCDLVPAPPDTGALRSDLLAVLQPFTHPLTRCERAAASLLGHAGRNTALDEVLQAGVVRPLAVLIEHVAAEHNARGPALPRQQVHLLGVVLQSLWWQRYTSDSTPSTGEEIAVLVDRLLLPVVLSV